jgi:hypothetical protein
MLIKVGLLSCLSIFINYKLFMLRSAIHDPQVQQQVVDRLQDPSDDVRLQAIYGVRRLVANGGSFGKHLV